MFILLEPGMKIENGDLRYFDGEWNVLKYVTIGMIVHEDDAPIKREINADNILSIIKKIDCPRCGVAKIMINIDTAKCAFCGLKNK